MRVSSASSPSRRSIAPRSSPSSNSYVVQADAESRLGDPLRVVVLVPEERQRDHRLAEVEALGGRVVPAVRDDDVGERQQSRLRDELVAPHVVGQLELGRLRALGDDEAVRRA